MKIACVAVSGNRVVVPAELSILHLSLERPGVHQTVDLWSAYAQGFGMDVDVYGSGRNMAGDLGGAHLVRMS